MIAYLGFMIDSRKMMISLRQEEVEQIVEDCDWALQQTTVSVRDLDRMDDSHQAGSIACTSTLQ